MDDYRRPGENLAGSGRKRRVQMSEATSVMLALTLSGGMQDAYSYFVRGKVFANAQTGNLVLMAEHMFNADFRGGVKYLFPLVFFAFGVFVAEQILTIERHILGRMKMRI